MTSAKQLTPSRAEETHEGRSWSGNSLIALAIRTVVFLAPLLVAFLATLVLSQYWEPYETRLAAFGRFVGLAVVATIVAAITDRGARRLLPLAALYRMSLVFPDQAPSRFAIAMRSGNTRWIESRLEALEAETFSGTQAEAASIIVELAAALGRHDRLTRGHSERVRAYAALMAEELGLSDEDSNRLQWAALIHDVGKLRIPQEILTKPSRLTEDEFDVIKTHPEEGMRLAEPLAEFLGPWMGAISEHHERFDGTGYPFGLRGQNISLGGRIVAVIDAFDVMTAARSYKRPQSATWAKEELARNAGSQFDPELVRAFLNIGIGRTHRSLTPMAWALQLPFLGTAVAAPVTQSVSASVLTFATATGVTAAAATGGVVDVFAEPPVAIANEDLQSLEDFDIAVDPSVIGDLLAGIEDGIEIEVPVEAPSQTVSPTTTVVAIVPPAALDAPTTTIAVPPALITTTTAPVTVPADETAPPPTADERSPTVEAAPATTAAPSPATSSDDCERLQSGESNLAGGALEDCDLSGVALGDVDFTGASFAGANLTGTTFGVGSVFVDVDFTGAQLVDVELADRDLSGVTFADARILRTSFSGADLGGADFSSATVTNVSFTGSDLGSAIFDSALVRQSDWRDANARQLRAVDASFEQVTMGGADLRSAALAGSSWSDSRFRRTNLLGIDLSEASFDGVVFENLALNNATLDGVFALNTDFSDVRAPNSSFEGAEFVGGEMRNLKLEQTNFDDVLFDDWAFLESNLQSSTFVRAQFLNNSSFAGSSLNATSFVDAELASLSIAESTVRGADFSGATGVPDDHESATHFRTICPDGTRTKTTCWGNAE